MRLSFLACTSAVVFLIAACSGAANTDLFGKPGASSSGGSSGASSGTSGSSGASSGTSGSSGASSGTSGNVDAGEDAETPLPDSGRPCNPMANTCGSGFYCEATSCTTAGVCKAAATEVDTQDIVCGCDGITYWNPSVAQNFGTTVAAKNSCALGGAATKRCSGTLSCSGSKTKCQKQVGNAAACLNLTTPGVCWRLPGNCPAVVNSTYHTCDATNPCTSLCKAIEKEQVYFSGAACTL